MNSEEPMMTALKAKNNLCKLIDCVVFSCSVFDTKMLDMTLTFFQNANRTLTLAEFKACQIKSFSRDTALNKLCVHII